MTRKFRTIWTIKGDRHGDRWIVCTTEVPAEDFDAAVKRAEDDARRTMERALEADEEAGLTSLRGDDGAHFFPTKDIKYIRVVRVEDEGA